VILYKIFLALAIMTTMGAVQLPLVFAAAPQPQGGNPHGELSLTHSSGVRIPIFVPRNVHENPDIICKTGGSGGSAEGVKVVPCESDR
jgi:hypothetical protein